MDLPVRSYTKKTAPRKIPCIRKTINALNPANSDSPPANMYIPASASG